MNRTTRRCPALPARPRLLILGLAATGSLALAACGSDSAGTAGTGGGAASSSETAAPADNGGGEGSPIRFVSSRNHYRVDFPARMTEAADGTATASRGTEQLMIQVVTGAGVSDPAAYAASDLSTVRSQSPGYRQVAALGQTALASRSVQKVVYTSTNGTNPVTGNPLTLVTARYYIPRDASTLAVVTYSIADNQYDPQGADDVAMTFQWQ